MIGEVDHEQLLVAAHVLHVDLAAKERRPALARLHRALDLAAQSEQALAAGIADADHLAVGLGDLIDA